MKKHNKSISFLTVFLISLLFLSNPFSELKAADCSDTNTGGDYTVSTSCAFSSDNTTTTVADSSTNANTGTPTSVTIVTGKYGSARSFTGGGNSYVTVSDGGNLPSALQITGAMTVSAWVKPTIAPDGVGRLIVSTYDWDSEPTLQKGWSFGNSYGSTDYIYFKVFDSSGNSATAINNSFFANNLNQWAHVAGVYVPSQSVKLYVNGILVAEDATSVPAAIAYSSIPLRIGNRADGVTQGTWAGQIDDVRVYNYARSETQINEDMDNGSITGSLPVGWWRMDDGYINGIDNGNLTVAANQTLTINEGQTIVWNPGKGITIAEGASIAINTAGQLKQGYLWVSDSDGDGLYYDNTQVIADSQPTGYVRRKDIIGPVYGDGSDGAVTFNTNTNLSTTAVASGRTAPDAINYTVGSIGTNSVTTSESGPVGLWHLDESANDSCSDGKDTCDSSGNGNHGTATGSTIVTGKYGNARSFSGGTEYVWVNNDSVLGFSQGTVEAWVKTTSTVESIFIYKYDVDPWPGYALRVNNVAGKASAWFGGGAWLGGTTTINDGVWHHIVATCNGSTLTLYVDGESDNSASQSCTGNTTVSNFRIGTINGSVDDVRVYNYARSASQIKGDVDGLVAGNNVLLMNLQGDATNYGNVGKYELLKIDSISGNIITFTTDIKNIYGATSSNATLTGQKIMIQRVPQYSNVTANEGVTVNTNTWDGTKGGVLAIMANGTYTANTGVYGGGTLDMSENGYRGGDCNGCGNAAWGDQGEGIKGTGTGSLSANGNGGGGGYGPSGFGGDPGAGGGHAAVGGNGVGGGGTAVGGTTAGEQTLLTTVFMGGGAGGGGDNDAKTPLPEYVSGGGIVILLAKTIASLYIDVTGETGISPADGGGPTGGGAGGSILVKGDAVTVSTVTSAGGAGGANAGNTGGAGSNGRNAIHYVTSLSGTTTPAAYSSQVSDAGSSVYLAEVNETTPRNFLDSLAHSFKSFLQ